MLYYSGFNNIKDEVHRFYLQDSKDNTIENHNTGWNSGINWGGYGTSEQFTPPHYFIINKTQIEADTHPQLDKLDKSLRNDGYVGNGYYRKYDQYKNYKIFRQPIGGFSQNELSGPKTYQINEYKYFWSYRDEHLNTVNEFIAKNAQ
jgi:hypothetical protein